MTSQYDVTEDKKLLSGFFFRKTLPQTPKMFREWVHSIMASDFWYLELDKFLFLCINCPFLYSFYLIGIFDDIFIATIKITASEWAQIGQKLSWSTTITFFTAFKNFHFKKFLSAKEGQIILKFNEKCKYVIRSTFTNVKVYLFFDMGNFLF